jgi:hypothetical protein
MRKMLLRQFLPSVVFTSRGAGRHDGKSDRLASAAELRWREIHELVGSWRWRLGVVVGPLDFRLVVDEWHVVPPSIASVSVTYESAEGGAMLKPGAMDHPAGSA